MVPLACSALTMSTPSAPKASSANWKPENESATGSNALRSSGARVAQLWAVDTISSAPTPSPSATASRMIKEVERSDRA